MIVSARLGGVLQHGCAVGEIVTWASLPGEEERNDGGGQSHREHWLGPTSFGDLQWPGVEQEQRGQQRRDGHVPKALVHRWREQEIVSGERQRAQSRSSE